MSRLAFFAPLLLLAAPLKTVPSVDLTKYAGTWYEIARLPNRFQTDCASNVVAIYTLNPDRTIAVANSCKKESGEIKVAEGVARVAGDGGSNSVLEVRFAPVFLSFLPFVWGDYRILALGPNYEFALVGTEDRKYLWLLSRTKELNAGQYKQLLAEAASQGFDVSKVVATKQN